MVSRLRENIQKFEYKVLPRIRNFENRILLRPEAESLYARDEHRFYAVVGKTILTTIVAGAILTGSAGGIASYMVQDVPQLSENAKYWISIFASCGSVAFLTPITTLSWRYFLKKKTRITDNTGREL
jgi:hypothetical protein